MSKQVKQFLKGEIEIDIGGQREFLVAAARSVLATGRDVETTATLLWEGYNGEGGIENCPWEEDDPWTPEGIYALVSDIYAKPPTSPLEKDFASDEFSLDDTGNGKRLVASFKDNHLIYVPELERWHQWDEEDQCFKATSDSWLRMRWEEITQELMRQARQIRDEGAEKALRTHARNSRMRPRVDAAVYFARDFVRKNEAELNTDKYLFAVKNGIVDLKTGELLDNTPEHLITRRSPINYVPRARSKLFDNFLKQSVPDDELREYLQLICGYTLTGSTDEDAFFYLYGRPATGKTTFSEALHHVMGSYAMTADTSSFMRDSQRTGSGPSEDLARLVGSRLVTMGEVEQHERLASALVSRITGGDAITARVLYGKTFEYHPQFKLWIAANELPRIAGTRSGIWRRVKIISFDQQVPLKKRDPLLRHKIKEPEAAEAILAWMVEGAVKWRRQYDEGHTLIEPVEVTEQVTEYQRESDHVSAFAAEAIEGTGNHKDRVPVADLYTHYRRWCDIEGRERREQQKALARKLRTIGFTAKPANVDGSIRRCWVGMKLLELEGSSGAVNIKGATKKHDVR
jgi:putative DNA primase/helicase